MPKTLLATISLMLTLGVSEKCYAMDEVKDALSKISKVFDEINTSTEPSKRKDKFTVAREIVTKIDREY